MEKSWRQKAFDTAAVGIIKQGGPSVGKTDMCRYRGPNGRKCAIGHLIPDDAYEPEMEGRALEDICDELFPMGEYRFCTSLQLAHDHCSRRSDFMPFWVAEMRKLADSYGLNAAALDTKGTDNG